MTTPSAHGPIHTARLAESNRLISTVASAYADLPVWRWLVPKTVLRTRVLTGYCQIMVAHVLAHGWVEVINDDHAPLAVAGWLPSTAPVAPPDFAQRVAAAGVWANRFHMPGLRFPGCGPLWLAETVVAGQVGVGRAVRRCQQRMNGLVQGQVSAIFRVRCRAWLLRVAGRCRSR